ncbi:hypothetical protein [Aeromicrobium sp. P5_D10]
MTNWRGSDKSGKPTTRLRLQPWKDPRLLIGVLLVLGATVLGARVLSGGDGAVEYWAVRDQVASGERVQEADLEPARVTLSGSTADNYIRVDEEFVAPLDQLVWAHDVAAGSLLVKAALVESGDRRRGELPLNVAAGSAPADLGRGDSVDVWVGPGPGDQGAGKASQILEAVRIVQSGDDGVAAGGDLAQTVLVEVDQQDLDASVIAAVASGHVTLVRVS